MRKTIILICIIILLPFFAISQVKKVVILETIDKESSISYACKFMIRSSLSKAITNIEGYEVYNRADIDAIKGMQNFKHTGIISDGQLRELRNMTGAMFALMTEVVKYSDTQMFIAVELVNIKTAKTEKRDNAIISSNPYDIQMGCESLANKMFVEEEFNVPEESEIVEELNVPEELEIAEESVVTQQIKKNEYNGHEYVDLGLSVKWATCNVGADSPEDYGDYFAWGETISKEYYDWDTYKYAKGTGYSMFKYCTERKFGRKDKNTTLERNDDAAQVNWGGSWRMPTRAEQVELENNCNWTKTTLNGVEGYRVTSKKNGNFIFLPAAGFRVRGKLINEGINGDYWSSSLSTYYNGCAYFFYFNTRDIEWDSNYRCYGRSVRAVCE
ncbi:MAG: hypothetical protein IJ341_03115 [Bacteroidales bacterium]|nr:hypothetical protein [Bacteroidales bacterium]